MYYLHFDYRDDKEPQFETHVQTPRLRPGEHLSEHMCPNDCGDALILSLQDRLYYCRRCEQEFEFTDIDP